jgi:hypothetical protein
MQTRAHAKALVLVALGGFPPPPDTPEGLSPALVPTRAGFYVHPSRMNQPSAFLVSSSRETDCPRA